MKKITHEEYMAINHFAKGLIECFTNSQNHAAVKTVILHLDLLDLDRDAEISKEADYWI
mgnify:FL=1